MPNDAWAHSPRLPEDVESQQEDRTCPLCGSNSFVDGVCSVCGYSEDIEGASPIQMDDLDEGEEDLVEGGGHTTDPTDEELPDEPVDDVEVVEDTFVETDVVEEGEEDLVDDGESDLIEESEGPDESDLVEDVEGDEADLVYDEGGILVFEDDGSFVWYIDGSDESGTADTLDDAVAEARDVADAYGATVVEGLYDFDWDGDGELPEGYHEEEFGYHVKGDRYEIYEEDGRYCWFVYGPDGYGIIEYGRSDTPEDAYAEVLSELERGSLYFGSRTATRHFTQSEIEELEDEIEGTTLANASRLRY